ncbi:LacI family transcriptional regulator [Gramella jeungdoensis]|uniref:LacI family transcriptional regulator n=1 Tax=Gramella jeungdoensis TaxID=708091 RepID=A0ABT0YY55_9FLAO|nr:LacI family DNA-binding transcriptional regulator [Gramella jeungdoensis]MCM8568403.1 LacI family transcriptional regulator [Gramella jeungdoensis]
MNKKMTLKELAFKLNLSISTVSKALNGSSEISTETKNRVKELATISNYFPNSFAQGLKSSKTNTLGIIVPDILPNFFSMVLDGIEEKATELGYKVIICISKESVEKEKQAIEMLIRSQVDGILISPSRETQATKQIEHLNFPGKFDIPLVMFDRILNEIEADKIFIDDKLEAELATLELLNSGCSRIVYISGITKTSVSENRNKGYRNALSKYNLEDKCLELEVNSTQYPFKDLKRLLIKEKIDGILTSDELTTVLTARQLLNLGFKIPEEVSLIGFTNGIMGETFLPSISTIDQKAREQGEMAVHTIADRIDGKLSLERLEFIIQADIIHRESTRRTSLSRFI